MQPAEEFNRLKLNREIQRRLRYVKARMRDMPIELRYVEGKIPDLPARIPPMPNWAKAAALAAEKGISKSIAHLQPKAGRPYKAGDLVELLGHMQALVTFMHTPSTEILDHEKELPELTQLRAPLCKQTARFMHRFLAKIAKRTKKKTPLPSIEQLLEANRRFTLGLHSFATPEGDMKAVKSLTTRVHYLIWMFRSEFVHHFTAPYIHEWLSREAGESPSDKLVEAVVTKLRKDARKIANPKVLPS